MADNIRPAGVFDTDYESDIALNRTRGDKLWKYGWLVALLALPVLTTEIIPGIGIIPAYIASIVTSIAIFTIAVQGLNILVGYTGQISLGHAAFMAVGGYAAALLSKGFELSLGSGVIQLGPVPFWVALPLAALFTGVVGLIFGLPSLRVKGFYLAMATLAAQFIIPWILENPLKPLTNAPNTLGDIPHPTFLGIEIPEYYLIIIIAAALMLAARNIMRTRTGRAFISIRDNDLAAELLGINVFQYKLQAFFLSALYAGIAGALLAYNRGTLNSEFFGLRLSIEMLAMLVIGGAGFPLGPIFGVAFVRLMTDILIPFISPFINTFLTSTLTFIEPINIAASLNPMIFGMILIIFLLVEPRGIAYRWEILKIAWKIRPYSY